jgi:adenosylcobinamide-GDP ribazoletransferase
MKDPHIGTYGVLALVCYMALLFASLYAIATSQFSDLSSQFSVLSSQLNTPLGGLGGSASQLFPALVIFAADAYSKMLASQIIMFLPYARTEQTAKNKTVYRKMSVPAGISLFLQGILPLLPLLYIGTVTGLLRWDLLVFIPCLVMYFLYYMMMRRLRGYTGDCCGALFLLIELTFYLTVALQLFTP